jgi:hypothetical protein
MLILPTAIMALLESFRPVFHWSTWVKVQVLLVGTILAPGKRTVTSALRAVGLADDAGFIKYHQVLNRAVWSSRRVSQVMLTLLLEILAHGRGPLVFGIDETIERCFRDEFWNTFCHAGRCRQELRFAMGPIANLVAQNSSIL